ncbi:MAG: Gfo/Idh/MocA family oxidoreductase [Ginsengibacter sp.]
MQKINTAICSFGLSGKVFHSPFISRHPGFNLYAVWERSNQIAKEIYPDVISYSSFEDMLADKAIDLIIVNTPNYTHYEFAKQALHAQKHVVVEKPFTVNVNEAEELVALAKKQRRILSPFQNRRYDSDFKTVKKIVDEGILGEIVEAEFHYDRYNLILSHKEHKETPRAGAGILHDLGPHLIDQALHLFGMPESVFGCLRTLRPSSRVNDYLDILLFYPAKTVRLKSGYIIKEAVPSFVLHGFNGSFLKPRADVQEDILQAGAMPGSPDWGTAPEGAKGILNVNHNGETVREFVPSLQGNYMEYYDGIYEAIVNNGPPPISAEDGLKVMKIIEAAQESDKHKMIIEIK